jgi:hypothetical protein
VYTYLFIYYTCSVLYGRSILVGPSTLLIWWVWGYGRTHLCFIVISPALAVPYYAFICTAWIGSVPPVGRWIPWIGERKEQRHF